MGEHIRSTDHGRSNIIPYSSEACTAYLEIFPLPLEHLQVAKFHFGALKQRVIFVGLRQFALPKYQLACVWQGAWQHYFLAHS